MRVLLDTHLLIWLAEASPRVVHFQHLNHLSTSLPAIAKRRGMLNIFTLHGARRARCMCCNPQRR